MGLFARKQLIDEPLPVDPQDPLVEHLYATYPYGRSPFGMRSTIQLVVWTVMQMRDRGYLK